MNVAPNMKKQIAPAIRPERMFLRASFLSMWGRILQLHVRDHRTEQQREVQEREQVQLQRRRTVGSPVEAHGEGDERDPEHDRGDEVDAAERADAERQLGDRVKKQAVEQDLAS